MTPRDLLLATRPRPQRPKDGTVVSLADGFRDQPPVTANRLAQDAARARNLPERPAPSASLDAYVAYLDAMCAYVRGMAVKAGRLYHAEKLAELEGLK